MAMPKRKREPMEGLPRLSGRDVVAAANEDAPRPRSSRKTDFEKVMYRLLPRQITALRAEAHRRAEVKRKTERVKVVREDASEVLREILEQWLAKS